MPVKSLYEISQSIVLAHASLITDIGDAPYRIARAVLFEMSASQLQQVEAASSHIHPDSEEIWKLLCRREFIGIRILLEDGKQVILPPSGYWRDLYEEEEANAIQKLSSLRTKMRSQAAEHLAAKRTVIAVDAIQVNNRKKLNSTSLKPRSLMEKTRAKSKEVSRIYAPRRKSLDVFPVSPLRRPLPPSNTPSLLGSKSPSKKPPTKVVTVVRTIKSFPTSQRSVSIPPSFHSTTTRPTIQLPASSIKPSPLAHTTTSSEQILNSRISTSLPPSSPRPASATGIVKRPATNLFMPKKSKIVPRK